MRTTCACREWGYGITNIVARPTPGIDTLRPDEYVTGRVRLRRKVRRYAPSIVAMVGVTVFRAMFPERKGAVSLGLQPERLGESVVFVLPNPSGRNANFSYGRDACGVQGTCGGTSRLGYRLRLGV